MKQNSLYLKFTEDSLTIVNIDPSNQSQISTLDRSHSKSQAIEIEMKIETFLKIGKLQENWFALKPRMESNQFAEFRFFKADILEENWVSVAANLEFGQFDKFRQQALELREFLLQFYGDYRSVADRGNRYIITFDRGEVALEFAIDLQGRMILPQFLC